MLSTNVFPKRCGSFGREGSKFGRGTPIYHRAATYAREALVVTDATMNELSLHEVFDRIALTNTVACSPRKLENRPDDRSRPTKAMWSKCSAHVLKPVLGVLKPGVVLVLGKSENMWWVVNQAFRDDVQTPLDLNSRWIWGRALRGGPRVIAVPHPSARGVPVASVLQDLRVALRL